MGLLDGLFGAQADIPSNRKMRNLDITPREYEGLRGQLAALIGGAVGGGQQLDIGGIPSANPRAVPMTAQESSLVDQLFSRAGAAPAASSLNELLASYGRGGTALQRAGEGNIADTLSGKYLDPASNPWLSKTVQAAAGDLEYDWQNRVLPNLRASFTGSGQTVTPGSFGSSAFDRAGALAANEQQRNLRDMATSIYGNAYQQERSNQLQAVGLGQSEVGQRIGAQAAGLADQREQDQQALAQRQAQTAELVDTLNKVALPRIIEQLGVDAGTAEFRNRLATLLQLLGMDASLTGVSVASPGAAAQGSSGVLGSLLAAGGQIGAAAAMPAAASDRRLKRDIIRLGVRIFGNDLYEFRYIGERIRRWGVMAQEVPEKARVVMPSGFLAVRYNLLGVA